ncbi:MAG: exosortase C-terminal domain/associated protein EpsI [Terriglobales bacterium]
MSNPSGAALGRRCCFLGLALLLCAAAMGRAVRPAAPPSAVPLHAFPLRWPGWRGTVQPLTSAQLHALHLHDYLNRVYFGPDGRVIGLYIAYYPTQTFGDDIHSPKHCLPGTGWIPVENDALTIPTAAGAISVNRYLVARGSQRELILYWFQQQGRAIRSEYWSKFYQVWDGLRRHRSDAALVRVAVPVAGNAARAQAEGTAFVRLIIPHLSRYVPN